jgi:hypothetical protein
MASRKLSSFTFHSALLIITTLPTILAVWYNFSVVDSSAQDFSLFAMIPAVGWFTYDRVVSSRTRSSPLRLLMIFWW